MCFPAAYFRLRSFWQRPVLRPGHLVLLFPGTALFDGDFSHPPLISLPASTSVQRGWANKTPRSANLSVQNAGIWGPTDTLTQTNGKYLPGSLRFLTPHPNLRINTHSLDAFSTLSASWFLYTNFLKPVLITKNDLEMLRKFHWPVFVYLLHFFSGF